jgi:membrane-associated protein
MEIITQLIDFVLHIDKHLAEIIKNYGAWTYMILFMIIFCETGLVVTPFLPGDSFLFALGALGKSLNLPFAYILLVIAAILGNTTNYLIGKFIGDKILSFKKFRIIKPEHLEKTHAFYEKHGGKAIILSRFFPIIRTFAPFVAGAGKMSFVKFSVFNMIGGISWITAFILLGVFFGNIPAVKENFTFVIIGIVGVSFLPAAITFIKSRTSKK